MKIRAGYEIAYQCPQPTPMIVMLSVHPSRTPDLITLDQIRLTPAIPANAYRDGFGNVCHVIHAPAGKITLSADFLIEDSGAPDDVVPYAMQHSLEKLPVETVVYLLGSRYCETDRFIQLAWAQFGAVAKGWPLVQAICDYVHDRMERLQARQSAQDGLACARRTPRRLPRLRPPCDHAVPLHEYSGALLHRLPRRHWRTARSRADGFFRLVRGLSWRPLVHLRRAAQQAAYRPHSHGARARRHRCCDLDLVRSLHAGRFQGDDRRSARSWCCLQIN
jgi:hypothetical protein